MADEKVVQTLEALARGPFLLSGPPPPSSPYYRVVETPLGPAVIPTPLGRRRLGLRIRYGEGRLLEVLAERVLLERLKERGLPYRRLHRRLYLIPTPKGGVYVGLAKGKPRGLPRDLPFLSLLAPGGLQDLDQVLDAHLGR